MDLRGKPQKSHRAQAAGKHPLQIESLAAISAGLPPSHPASGRHHRQILSRGHLRPQNSEWEYHHISQLAQILNIHEHGSDLHHAREIRKRPRDVSMRIGLDWIKLRRLRPMPSCTLEGRFVRWICRSFSWLRPAWRGFWYWMFRWNQRLISCGRSLRLWRRSRMRNLRQCLLKFSNDPSMKYHTLPPSILLSSSWLISNSWLNSQ